MFKFLRKQNSDQIEITVSNRTVIRVVLVVFIAIVVLAALRRAQHALILVFTAFFLSLALNAPVQWVAHHLPGKMRGKRSVATAVSFLVVVIVLAAFLASIVPPLVNQVQNFINAVPSLAESAREGNGRIGHLITQYHLQGQIHTFSTQLNERLQHIGSAAISSLGKIGSSIFSLLTVLALTFMMLIEGPMILEFFRELIPHRHQDHADTLALDMYRVVKGFINGQVILAAVAALLISPALFILHISYPVALMVVIFFCGLIPMVGHTIGAIIVTLVALATSPASAIIILAYYILYQQIENYAVQPRIQANSTNMSPLLIFMSVVIGVSFGGLFGGLFAIPVAGCIRIAVLDYLKEHEIVSDKPVVEEVMVKADAK